MSGMETYTGHVRSPTDAIILFEACRIGLLPRVQRRLSEKERQSIKSGSVFVWDEREAGMRRWTDGKSWSASRVSGSFLTYREMEGKRGCSGFDKNANRDGVQGNEGDSDGGPDGYRYKPDGLMKQSFSITTNDGHHLHLISYYSRQALTANNLMLPSNDPQLRHIRPEKGMYPESTVHEQSNIPAVTRGPMGSPGYTHSPNQPAPYQRTPSYAYPHPHHPGWAPPSPMHTPPPYPQYGPYYHHPYAAHTGPYPGSMHYPPPPPHHAYGQHGAPPMTAFDRPPPPIGGSGLPPPSHHSYPPPPHYGAYPPPYHHGAPQYPPQAPPTSSYEARPPAAETARASHESRTAEARADPPRSEPAKTSVSPPRAAEKPAVTVSNPPSQSTAPGSSGQTIPSISAMLNAGENGQPPARTQSRSPNGTPPRPLQDIPSHKLGFEANRDMHTLRNLDKSTFKF